MRITLAVAVACLTFGGLAAAGDATAAIRKSTDIPAQGLGPALTKLAKEFDFQVLYRTEIVSDLKSPGATGALTSDEALGKLLTGTGLTYKYLDDKTVTIVPVSSADLGQTAPPNAAGPSDSVTTSKEAGKNSSQSFRVAQLDQGKGSSPSPVGEQTSKSQENSKSPSAGLAEIIVTAQKRSERLQDVPVPVTAISAQALVDNNQLRLQDYYIDVPGLNFATGNRGEPFIAIRGITTSPYNNPTVGITVDDVPYGASTVVPTGIIAPDLDPSDLERVEVLRGPQGTLYGASSLGGLLKYVTVDPSTDERNGRVQAGFDRVVNGRDLGYSFRAAGNVPLSDTLAVRASGYANREPGYVDNLTTGQNGVNETDGKGGHLAALWRPSDLLSLKLSAIVQDTTLHGSPYVDPSLGDLKQEAVRGTGYVENKFQAYSAILTAKVGIAELTAISGYNVTSLHDSVDGSAALGFLSDFFFDVGGAPITEAFQTRKFSQEIRLAMALGSRVDWLVGLFYTHEATDGTQNYAAASPVTGAILGSSDAISTTDVYYEYAAFTDFTIHFGDRFDVQVGGRKSTNHQSHVETDIGVLNGGTVQDPATAVYPEATAGDHPFTYLVTPRLKLAPDLMIYARLASGYRTGGYNAYNAIAVEQHIPATYRADTTDTYELGTKADFLDNRLSIDASLYYIDWRNIQLFLNNTAYGAFETNEGRAKSEGLEVSVESRPITGLTVSGWVAWNTAELRDGFPANSTYYGPSGARLPLSSRFSGHLALEQQFQLTTRVAAFVGGAVSYVGDRQGLFSSTPERANYPAYTQVEIKGGLKLGTWTANIFANNVTDRRGILFGGIGAINPATYNYIQPRTVGLNLVKTF